MSKITPQTLRDMKKRGEKIVALTAYDAATARLLNEEKVDVILVGDSAGNVKLGYENTLPVTMEEMLLLTQAVKRGNGDALLTADMPAGSYERGPGHALKNARRLTKEGGAEAVKLEGASPRAIAAVRAMKAARIPVVGHVGLTPQSAARRGGYRVQGRDAASARRILAGALALEKAGVFALVIEATPASLAREVTKSLKIPVIGIGAGVDCDGQILVVDDLLGLTPPPRPRFVRAYADLRAAAARAVKSWRADVKAGDFPGPAETY